MPSKNGKRELYIASNMADLQQKSEFKPSTTNARILAKSADAVFRDAEKCSLEGDEERAFILYMRYFSIVKSIKRSADYKQNAKYYDELIGQKNQLKAIEQAEAMSGNLKERYDLREAEAVAQKFAKLEASGMRKVSSDVDVGSEHEDAVDSPEVSTVGPSSISSNTQESQLKLNPTQLYNLMKEGSTTLVIMDTRTKAEFDESHLSHRSCISVPQDILPPGTNVTQIESALPTESLSMWKQRGNVDHIVLLDWTSSLESLSIGSTLRTLKDALYKFDSTVIIKSEPLVLEGGYSQWLLFYPMMTTNPKVARPTKIPTKSTAALLDFDYPDLKEPEPATEPDTEPTDRDSINQSVDTAGAIVTSSPESASLQQPAASGTSTPSGSSTPQFNRALKPKTVSKQTFAESIAKTSDMNNVRNVNLTRQNSSGEGLSLVNNLYPNVSAALRRPEKNTNIDVEKKRSVEDQTEGRSSQQSGAGVSSATSNVSLEEVEQEVLKLQELQDKRKKEERALADIMRKKRAAEKDLQETTRLAEQERMAIVARDTAVREEEAERQRQADVARMRQIRKEQELQREKERQQNVVKEKAMQEAQARAQKEEAEKRESEQRAAELRAEQERRERADHATREAEAAAQKKREDEERAAVLLEAKRREEERLKRLTEDEQRLAAEREKAEEIKRAREDERKKEELSGSEMGRMRQAQEPKVIPSPSLPPGWEKRLDRKTQRYYYIDHNNGTTQWEPPSSSHHSLLDKKAADTHLTNLREEPDTSSRSMSRSHSSPDIMKDLAREASTSSVPLLDRANKPLNRQADVSRAPVEFQVARRRDLNPIYGNVGAAITGLRNLGNTCYMNSTIQCLNNTTPLVTYFLTDDYLQDINRDSEQGMHGEVVDEFAVVIKALWSGQYRCITPRDLKNTVGKYNPMFAGCDQQDSQEFLTFLLDGLHEGLNEVKHRPRIPDQENDNVPDQQAAKVAWEGHKLLNRSIIVELFQGQLKSTLMCRHCRKTSVTFQAFMYLSLPIPGSSKCSLQDCFRAFLQPELLTGSSKWKCPKCKVEREAEKKIDIWKLPPILLIHLSRFVNVGMWREKITHYVDFPIDGLDLQGVTIGPAQRARYHLYGVSNHYGTMEGGHYTAFCRNPCNSKWHKFDDHEVYDMSKSEIKTSAAFVLYYTSIPLNAPVVKPLGHKQ